MQGTLAPRLQFDRESLSLLVAVIGTTLSADLSTWQSNEEVEEEIAMGRTRLQQRRGATAEELGRTRRDILFGMLFANVIMHAVMLSTASTLHRAGQTDVETAAQAARPLQPLAGDAAGILFALGIIGVGFLAVPVMTTGAAHDLVQALGGPHPSLQARPREAKGFYAATLAVTGAAVALDFLGVNPMRALVWSRIVQGFSTPPLMLLIMLMTSRPDVMGDRVNGRGINALGWATTACMFAASAGLVITWLR